jgi:hypothetical protein
MLSWARSDNESSEEGLKAFVADFFEYGQGVEHRSQRPSIPRGPVAANDAIIFGNRLQLAPPCFPGTYPRLASAFAATSVASRRGMIAHAFVEHQRRGRSSRESSTGLASSRANRNPA